MAGIDIIEVIRFLPKLGRRIEKLRWKGRFDGKGVDVKLFDFSLVTNRIRIKTEFAADGATHVLHATYSLTDQESDEIQFDGSEVKEDDVRFDIDIHLLCCKLEYWFRFATLTGEEHELYLEAKVYWFSG